MRAVSRIIFKFALFIAAVVGIVYYASAKLDSIDVKLNALLAKNDYKISYSRKNLKFRLLSNSIIFHDVVLNKTNTENSPDILRADEMKAQLSFLSLISGSVKAESIVLQNPIFNVYKNQKNDDERSVMGEFFRYSEHLNDTKLEIRRGRIVSFDEKLIVIKELNDVSGLMSKKNSDLNFDLQIQEDLTIFKLKFKLRQLKKDKYSAEGSFFNDSEKLEFKFDTEFDGRNMKSASGAVDASGRSFPNLVSVLCSECSIEQDLSDSAFKFSSKIDFDVKNNLLKLDKIDYKDKIADYKGVVSYDMIKKNINIDIKSERWNLGGSNEQITLSKLKNQIVDSEFSFLSGVTGYFNFLQDSSFSLNFIADRIELFGSFITGVELRVLSDGKRIEIQKLYGKLNDIHEIISSGKILHNPVRNRLEISVDIPFDTLSGIKFDASVMAGDMSFSNILISDGKLKLTGDIFLRRNKESNDLSGRLLLTDMDLNSVMDYSKAFLATEDVKGDLLSSLLVVLSKTKLNSNLQIVMENLIMNTSKIDRIKIEVDIDDKQIALSSSLVDKDLFNLKNRIQLFWDKLNPKVVLRTSGDFLNIEKFLQLFGVNQYKKYFLVSEEEFKKNTDSIIWKNFNINLRRLLNMNFVISNNIKNISSGTIKIKDFKSDIVSENNLIRINSVNAQVGNASFNLAGNLDLTDQVVIGLITAQNIDTNDFKVEKEEFPTYLSFATRFSTSGYDFHKIINNIILNAAFVAKNVKIKNLDVNLFVNNVHKLTDYASLVSLSERSVVYGKTILEDMSGNINAEGGLIKTSFNFSTERFAGAGLVNGLVQNLAFKGLSRIAFIPYKWQGTVYADLDWSGNLFNVNKAFDLEKLKSILSNYK